MGESGRLGQHAVEVACTVSRRERVDERTPPHLPHSPTHQGFRLRQGRREYNDKVGGCDIYFVFILFLYIYIYIFFFLLLFFSFYLFHFYIYIYMFFLFASLIFS